EQQSGANLEAIGMRAMASIFSSSRRFEAAQRLGRIGQWPFVSEGWVKHLPGMLGNWTSVRDLRPLPKQSFRGWWRERAKKMDSKGVL
ncbi:MAG TPA: lactate utilization protein LutB domain-containing protein, partial [Alloacidobacterium sp.]|nr:lactate utilization protein LutB domain-containing protein [Alloacidobacterium sp.]